MGSTPLQLLISKHGADSAGHTAYVALSLQFFVCFQKQLFVCAAIFPQLNFTEINRQHNRPPSTKKINILQRVVATNRSLLIPKQSSPKAVEFPQLRRSPAGRSFINSMAFLAPIPLFSCKCEKLEGGEVEKRWKMGNGQRQHRINCTGVHLIDS